MRASEYYAAGIHGFFVGFGLDAIDRDERAAQPLETARDRWSVDGPDADYDFDPDDSCYCMCAAMNCPPCSHCENDHDEIAAACGMEET